jgi:hypothetical protein
MYRDWVLPIMAIILIIILVWFIYYNTKASEGFLVAVPPQEYAIPELKGVMGRYVRIRPSLTNGDGYLSISQIQVIDVNGTNISLKKPVYATSSGGSPIDKKYGTSILIGNTYRFAYGISAGPSSVVDGVNLPRAGLTNIFETSVQNACPTGQPNCTPGQPDNQYLEIDLSANQIIKTIIYTGRSEPINTSFETIYNDIDRLDQISRLTNMRLEIYDTNRVSNTLPVYSTTFSENPLTHMQTIPINMNLFTINSGAGSSGAQFIQVPNLESYKALVAPFTTLEQSDMVTPNLGIINSVNGLYSSLNTTSPKYKFDISGSLFSSLALSSPINFYNDIFLPAGCPNSLNMCKANSMINVPASFTLPSGSPSNISIPSLAAPISVQIFGTASAAAQAEMTNSIKYCQAVFLGNPSTVENYIAVKYHTTPANIAAYIRDPNIDPSSRNIRFCMPDIMQVFDNGNFIIDVKSSNVSWNNGRCNTLLTPTILSLIPFMSRNFIVRWIQNRTVRYIHHTNIKAGSLATQIPETASPIVIPYYIDVTSATVIDSIAQQFYEMLGGQFTMAYIYDVLPLGSTMIDVRFDLTVHTDITTAYGPIADLKRQYQSFLAAGSKTHTQDIVEQANIDYHAKLDELENDSINSVSSPYQGVVARMFYTRSDNGAVTITGMILDDKAVTSFIPELNGGMTVPLGTQPGNVNYLPKIKYTKNDPQDAINCSEPATIRRIMDDYLVLVNGDSSILKSATPPVNVKDNKLYINRVIGATQLSPTQCGLEWLEVVYDPVTNLPVSQGRPTDTSQSTYIYNVCDMNDITRYGIFSYNIDTSEWSSPNLIFDPSGFKLYSTNNIPACVFTPADYANRSGNRFKSIGSTTTSAINTIKQDFVRNGFKGGNGQVCPHILPNYTFNPAHYLSANPTLGTSINPATHYASTGLAADLAVKGPTTIAPLTSPVIYNKPLPTETNLDNASGVCPTTNCKDGEILFSLVDQYNSNPALPGTILRVKRANTPNPYQCDVDVDINYDTMIKDLVGIKTIDPASGREVTTYPMIKKGTVTYDTRGGVLTQGSKPMTLTGVQVTNMALYVAIDNPTCSYTLADASGVDTGTSIQENTPFLYKRMDYVKKLAELGSSIGSSISKIQSDFSVVSGSAKAAVSAYRANTYNAVGATTALSACSGTCNDASIKNMIMNYYQTTFGLQMTNILKIGSIDGKSCDVTFTNSSQNTVGMQFGLGGGSTCSVNSWKYINPTPPMAEIQDMSKPLSTANMGGSVSGFTNYSKPVTDEAFPLKARSFGLDRARNSTDSYTETQFKTPLDQTIPQKDFPEKVSYRFIRFVPLKTRDPKSFSVDLGKVTFFSEGSALKIEGKVDNPMGTWEGTISDIMGPGFRNGWSDAHKKPLVFAFKAPISVDGYSITTSEGDRANDPVSWKVEGSTNGSFWTVLDTQTKYPTPVERFREIPVQEF